MEKEDIGLIGKLVSENFNQLTQEEKKQELHNAIVVGLSKVKRFSMEDESITKNLVNDNSEVGSKKVTQEELGKMLIESGNSDILSKIGVIRDKASNISDRVQSNKPS